MIRRLLAAWSGRDERRNADLQAQLGILRNENVAILALLSRLTDDRELLNAMAQAHDRTAARCEMRSAAHFARRSRHLKSMAASPRKPDLRLVEFGCEDS